MVDLLGCCDVYVSLHRSEGFGFGMAEAMALGKPVIATGLLGQSRLHDDLQQLPGRIPDDRDNSVGPRVRRGRQCRLPAWSDLGGSGPRPGVRAGCGCSPLTRRSAQDRGGRAGDDPREPQRGFGGRHRAQTARGAGVGAGPIATAGLRASASEIPGLGSDTPSLPWFGEPSPASRPARERPCLEGAQRFRRAGRRGARGRHRVRDRRLGAAAVTEGRSSW